MATLEELKNGDAHVCILTDGRDVVRSEVCLATEFEELQERAKEDSQGELYWIQMLPVIGS